MNELPHDALVEVIQMLTGTLELKELCEKPEIMEVPLLLYTRDNPDDPVYVYKNNSDQILPKEKTIVIIHGWTANPHVGLYGILKDTYLEHFDFNVIMIDWSELAKKLYTTCFCKLPGVAEYVANYFCYMDEEKKIPMDSVHIAGHSLGGQMAGLIGAFTQSNCQKEIGRITGMDPAGPLYMGAPPSKRLDESDARFVQIIHTNGGILGYYDSCGDVDFYVNCGMHQSGCSALNPLCSHLKVENFMVEGVFSKEFVGKSCVGCPKDCATDVDVYAVMGEHCPEDAPKRNYYLATNADAPYGMGCDEFPHENCTEKILSR